MAYSPAGDLVQSIGQAAESKAREIVSRRELRDAENTAAYIKEVEFYNAGNLAEKQALRAALRKLSPDHPLLTNTLLQEKIKEAGRRALALTDDWDAARDAGDSFRYDE